MRNLKITKEGLATAAKATCNVAATLAVFVLPNVSSVKNVIDEVRYYGKASYSDAINVILNSKMYSNDKTEVAAMIPKDKDADFYKSIINAARSNLYSGDKVMVIKNICDREEES